MSVSQLAETPDRASATVTATSADGHSLTFTPRLIGSNCRADRSLWWDGPDAKGTQAANLGTAPFDYDPVEPRRRRDFGGSGSVSFGCPAAVRCRAGAQHVLDPRDDARLSMGIIADSDVCISVEFRRGDAAWCCRHAWLGQPRRAQRRAGRRDDVDASHGVGRSSAASHCDGRLGERARWTLGQPRARSRLPRRPHRAGFRGPGDCTIRHGRISTPERSIGGLRQLGTLADSKPADAGGVVDPQVLMGMSRRYRGAL